MQNINVHPNTFNIPSRPRCSSDFSSSFKPFIKDDDNNSIGAYRSRLFSDDIKTENTESEGLYLSDGDEDRDSKLLIDSSKIYNRPRGYSYNDFPSAKVDPNVAVPVPKKHNHTLFKSMMLSSALLSGAINSPLLYINNTAQNTAPSAQEKSGNTFLSFLANYGSTFSAPDEVNRTIETANVRNLQGQHSQAKKLSRMERVEKIKKYLLKKQNRKYAKLVRYQCRKSLADKRIRFQGRFVKQDQLEVLNLMLEKTKINESQKKNIFKTEIDTTIRDKLLAESRDKEVKDNTIDRKCGLFGDDESLSMDNISSTCNDGEDISMGDPSFMA